MNAIASAPSRGERRHEPARHDEELAREVVRLRQVDADVVGEPRVLEGVARQEPDDLDARSPRRS